MAAAGVAAALLLAGAPPSAAQAPPPDNDHYLESTPVNERGSRLPRRSTVRVRGDNSAATVQANIFDPCGLASCPAGPAEPTTCRVGGSARRYGKTVWFDFYPDRSALARIQVNALFDPIIGIFEFDPASGRPRGAGECVDRLDFVTEELELPVRRDRAYTVQVGVRTDGFEPAGGRFEALFDFLRLPRVSANPTLRARPTRSGIRVSSLRLRADRGARARLSCTRRACRTERRTVRGMVSFRSVRNRNLRAGTRIRIRVTRENEVGRYFEYRVARGDIRRIERCLEPGSSRPRRRCS